MLLPSPGMSRTAALRCAAAGAEWVIDRLAAAIGNSAAMRAAFPKEGIDRQPAPKLRKMVTFFSDVSIWSRSPPWSTGCSLARSESREPRRVAPVDVVVIGNQRAARHRGQIGHVERHQRRNWDDLLGRVALFLELAAEQPASEPRRVLEPDTAAAI